MAKPIVARVSGELSATAASEPRIPLLVRYALATLSGILYFLGWAGFDYWPLSFVAFVPALVALEGEGLRARTVIGLGFMAGLAMNVGGYYWVATTLRVFSGFSYFWCVLFASILWAYQGLALSIFAGLYRLARGWGARALIAAPVAICVTEWLFPELFQHYFGGSLHGLPLAIQVADIGGPLLVTGLLMAANVGLYELTRRALRSSADLKSAAIAAGLWIATLGYGAYRIHEVDSRAHDAPQIEVGVVQANMGLTEKREDPNEGLRRHLALSVELERKSELDLLIWPESAFGWFLPENVKNVRDIVMQGVLKSPILFGGLAERQRDGKRAFYNTAYMADAKGDLVGSYDKTYLLAFGEYIPFGDVFPQLYEISRNSGRFVPGDHVRPLPLGDYRMGVLICYEDIIPEFVTRAVREGNPHLLINITNDAWFGNTHEPWQHLALAKFRAVEHHRALVRSTNSGVSSVIDPVGRMVAVGPVFERTSFTATVPMLQGDYAYLTLGSFPGYGSLLYLIGLGVLARRRVRR